MTLVGTVMSATTRYLSKRQRGEETLSEKGKPSALHSQVDGDHYKRMAIQPIEFCQKNKLGFCESLAIKYLSRHQWKAGAQDIKKAIHCMELLLEMEYPDEAR